MKRNDQLAKCDKTHSRSKVKKKKEKKRVTLIDIIIINNIHINNKTNEIDNLLLILNSNSSFILYKLPSFTCEVYDVKCAC
jgi:hypothetical protein